MASVTRAVETSALFRMKRANRRSASSRPFCMRVALKSETSLGGQRVFSMQIGRWQSIKAKKRNHHHHRDHHHLVTKPGSRKNGRLMEREALDRCPSRCCVIFFIVICLPLRRAPSGPRRPLPESNAPIIDSSIIKGRRCSSSAPR